MNTDQGAQEEPTALIDCLKNFGIMLRRGTQRKAVRTLVKELDVMMKAVPPETFATSQVGVLLALLISLQESISDIEERLFTIEERLVTLQEQIDTPSGKRRV